MSAAHVGRSAGTTQDFRTKYTRTNALTRRLLDGFFGAVAASVAGLEIRSAIEVGCGEGFSTAKLGEILPRDAMLRACDIEQRLVDEARRRNPDVLIERASIYELPHGDAEFDAVFVMEVLEHLDDPDRGLAEVCRVSRRWVIATVPREPIWRILNLARLKYVSALGNTPGHLNHWSSRGFRRFIDGRAEVRGCRTPLPWTVIVAEVRR